VLWCVAVCCSVLQCVPMCVAVFWLGIPNKAANSGASEVCCSVLQCVAVCCSVMQCVLQCFGLGFQTRWPNWGASEVCLGFSNVFQRVCFSLWAGGSNQGGQLGEPLMCVAVCCSVLQSVAESCSVCVAVSWVGIRIKAVNSGCVAVCCSVLQCVRKKFFNLNTTIP